MPATLGLSANFVVKYDQFPKAASLLKKNVQKIIQSYVEDDLQPTAQANQSPHIDTGALNDSGTITKPSSMSVMLTFTGGAATGWTGEPRVYAAYHEYGTVSTGAYPFLT